MTSRVGVGVRQAGQQDPPGRVDPPGVGGRGERRADLDDPVLLDEDVSPRERGWMTREDLSAADEQCDGDLRRYFFCGRRSFV
jgi:hypothetical protein